MNSTPDSVLWFIGIVGLFNFIALTFLAIRLRAPVQITVEQPNLTVQAPHAVLPPELMDTLQRVNEKLAPPLLPTDDAVLGNIVAEAIVIADMSKGLKGVDKFRIARAHAQARAAQLNMSIDDRVLALRIESTLKLQRK